MKFYSLGIVVCMAAVFTACTNDHHHAHSVSEMATDTVAVLEKQVLAVHDSVMAQMSDLMQLRKDVSDKVAQTEGAAKKQGVLISQQLKQADEVMMDWMHQYKGDTLKKLDQEKALEYLKIQQEKVNDLSRLMRKSLSDAEKYLNE